MRGIIETNICGLNVTITPSSIHIEDSYYITLRALMKMFFIKLRKDLKDSHITMDTPLNHRSDRSLCNEWIAHNNLYILGYEVERTAHLDLNRPQKWYVKVAYWLLSRIVL